MRKVIIFLLLTSYCTGFAQENSRQAIAFETLMEELLPILDDDINYEELYEILFEYYSNPIELNEASPEELVSLFVLSDVQIIAFFNYKKNHGKLLSIYELQAIPTFDLVTIQKIYPFVTVNRFTSQHAQSLLYRITHEKNNYLLLRYQRVLEEKKGFKTIDDAPPRYVGAPHTLLAKFRVNHYKDFSFGFTMEKDAGEQIRWNPASKNYGTDFNAFHFTMYNKGKFKNITIGDFNIQSGQGLLLSGGFSLGKSSETITTMRRSDIGIIPHTSVLENGFFRGIAATYSLHKFEVSSFYSNRNLDATLNKEDPYKISTIRASGLHRTETELEGKRILNEQVIGTKIKYKRDDGNLSVGINGLYTLYDKVLSKNPTNYNQFEFVGDKNYNYGLYFNYSYQNFNFFGETAFSKSSGNATIVGVIASLSSKVQTSLLYRNYSRNFHSFYGNALSENTRNINENGLYWGLKFTPNRKFIATAYFDIFKFPWLKFRVDKPSQGYEYMLRANYFFTKKTSLYFQYKEESKGINYNPDSDPINVVERWRKRSYLINLNVEANEILTLKTRVQFSDYVLGEITTNGFMILQDLNIAYRKFRVSTRVALFDTDDFNNRQYTYERDVLHAFSIPFYSGQGIRNYVLLRYKASGDLDLWLRYARTRYRNRDNIGSGLEEILGDAKTDVKFQVRYRF